jgi:hypothetical protein
VTRAEPAVFSDEGDPAPVTNQYLSEMRRISGGYDTKRAVMISARAAAAVLPILGPVCIG